MRKSVPEIIRFIALAMLVGGVIMCFVSKHQAWEADIGYYSRDSTAVAMWNVIFVQSIITAISSVFVCGFSYIVEAACKYLDRHEQEESVAASEVAEE